MCMHAYTHTYTHTHTHTQTHTHTVCSLPMVVGPCEALFPSWFYNSDSEECESFNYGGCEGNGNRFDSLEACESTCDDDDDDGELTCV